MAHRNQEGRGTGIPTNTIDAAKLHAIAGGNESFKSWIAKQIQTHRLRKGIEYFRLPQSGRQHRECSGYFLTLNTAETILRCMPSTFFQAEQERKDAYMDQVVLPESATRITPDFSPEYLEYLGAILPIKMHLRHSPTGSAIEKLTVEPWQLYNALGPLLPFETWLEYQFARYPWRESIDYGVGSWSDSEESRTNEMWLDIGVAIDFCGHTANTGMNGDLYEYLTYTEFDLTNWHIGYLCASDRWFKDSIL